jgi:hypothetical protein
MNEFVYKLNLPPLPEILSDFAKDSLFNETKDRTYRFVNIDCVKPEWLTFNNYNWDTARLFYKKNVKGNIHIDGKKIITPQDNYVNWGINWIHNGNCVMEYWLFEDVDVLPKKDILKDIHHLCKTTKPPYRTYQMPEGAYLVNTSYPHNATGISNRYGFSLRDSRYSENWDTVVNNFKNYII